MMRVLFLLDRSAIGFAGVRVGNQTVARIGMKKAARRSVDL